VNRLNVLGILCVLFSFNIWAQADEVKQSVWSQSYSLESKGEYEKAAALMLPLIDSQGVGEFALMRYGWLNYLQGNYNNAIHAYNRALEHNTHSFDARLGIALPLMAQKRWRKAAYYLTQIIDQSPFQYTANMRLLACEEGLRQWDDLEKHASMMATYYPTDVGVLVYLARSYAWQGETLLAMQTYRQVLVRMPNHLEALKYLKQ